MSICNLILYRGCLHKFKQIRNTVYLKRVLAFLLLSPTLLAQVSLPPVNLGATSFLDGIGGPGTLVEATLTPYSADKLMDNKRNVLPVFTEIRNISSILLVAHLTEKKILGGFYGFEILIPLVDLDVDVNGRSENSGVGDILVSPFMLQWSNQNLFGLSFNHRLNVLFSLPLGSYNNDESLNVGTNTYSFNPYYAFTIELSEKVETSFRLHYLWNGKNSSPNNRSNAESTQAGEAFHMNFATSYKLTDHFRIGLSGYYLRQISAHKVNGVSQMDSKEHVLGVGPGIQYHNQGFKVVFNTYTESFVESRSKGHRIIFKVSNVF